MKMVEIFAMVWLALLCVPFGYAGSKRSASRDSSQLTQNKRARSESTVQAALNAELFCAAEEGNFEKLDACLTRGADIEATSKHYNGATPLFMAAMRGNGDMVEHLLRAGARVDIPLPVDKGATALYAAARGGHDHIVAKLLRARARTDIGLCNGDTPLCAAAAGGHIKVIRMLIDAGAELMPMGSVISPLQSIYQTIDKLKHALGQSTTSKERKVSLFVRLKQFESYQPELLKAYSCAIAENGNTILHCLLSSSANSIHMPLLYQCLKVLDPVLINHKNMNGLTALHSVAQCQSLDCQPALLRLIMSKGGDCRVTTPYGDTYDTLCGTNRFILRDVSQWTIPMRLVHAVREGPCQQEKEQLRYFLDSEKRNASYAKKAALSWQKDVQVGGDGLCRQVLCDIERRATHMTDAFEAPLSVAGSREAQQMLREHIRTVRREILAHDFAHDWRLPSEVIEQLLQYMGTYEAVVIA